jgi:hypothetical protein
MAKYKRYTKKKLLKKRKTKAQNESAKRKRKTRKHRLRRQTGGWPWSNKDEYELVPKMSSTVIPPSYETLVDDEVNRAAAIKKFIEETDKISIEKLNNDYEEFKRLYPNYYTTYVTEDPIVTFKHPGFYGNGDNYEFYGTTEAECKEKKKESDPPDTCEKIQWVTSKIRNSAEDQRYEDIGIGYDRHEMSILKKNNPLRKK